MFDLSRNQVVVFYQQNIWKTPAEEWYFYPASLLKMPLFSRCFSNIFLVKPTTWFMCKFIFNYLFTGSVTICISSRSCQPKVSREKTKPTAVFLTMGTSILKITEMGVGILIKHLSGLFFAVFYCWEGISCIKNKKVIWNDIWAIRRFYYLTKKVVLF